MKKVYFSVAIMVLVIGISSANAQKPVDFDKKTSIPRAVEPVRPDFKCSVFDRLGNRLAKETVNRDVKIIEVEPLVFDISVRLAAPDESVLGEFQFTVARLYISGKRERNLHYPLHAGEYIPALILQDEKNAVGISRMDIYNRRMPDPAELCLVPEPATGSMLLTIKGGEAFADLYRNNFYNHYRIRFGKPVKGGVEPLLQDALSLWSDAKSELDKFVPSGKMPDYDRTKNNIVIMNFFMLESGYVTQENPRGYLMQNPNWKADRWEWVNEKINPAMNDDEIRERTGFCSGNTGRPALWIRQFAERCVKEMKETNSMAIIVFRTFLNPSGCNYPAENQLFPPELEELMTVDSVKRPVIDEWARILTENHVEFGFLIRSSITAGQPWKQKLQRFDWNSRWQYEEVAGRIRTLRKRFGSNCRYFYLDEFGRGTPLFVLEHLRKEFPDAFFIAGWPDAVTDRLMPGVRAGIPPDELTKLLNPGGYGFYLPESQFTGKDHEDRKIVKKLWRQPGVFIFTHRGARRIQQLAIEE